MEDILDKKEAIFASTLELIKEHGFHGTPISLVVKNAGVAAGTVYHYFKSKDELICELYAYNRCRLLEIIDSAIAADLTYEEKFFNIYSKVYYFYIQNTNVLIFFEQFVNSPYHMNKNYIHSEGHLFDFFKEGVERGYVKEIDPEILKVLTLGSVATTAKLNKYGKKTLSNNELMQITKIFWDGISKN
ncbi:MAG: TetR/AcrR family transcriptional regulator [Balneolales bacterium]